MLGLDLVAKAGPTATPSGRAGRNMSMLPHTSRNVPYNVPRDFAPIALSTTNYLGIVSSNDAPFRTVGEMVAYAKANPGKLTVATNGEGGFPHMSFEQLRVMGGFTFTHVPYKGASALVTDIIGGQVMGRHHQHRHRHAARQVGPRAHARVTNRTRVSLCRRCRGERGVRATIGRLVRLRRAAGTPHEIVAKLNAEINRAIPIRT